MIYKIQPPLSLHAFVGLPASKSISNRVLLLNALSRSSYPVENLSTSDDTQTLWKALHSSETHLDVGAAGTSMRFLTAYLAQTTGDWTITGTERMKNRPIAILVNVLRALGADIDYLEKDGFPPLHIRGKKLRGGKISLDGSVSSQYLSALLMIAPTLNNGLELQLEGNIISRPYISMTIRLMEQYGVQTEWEKQTIRIRPQMYRPIPFRVESDWSAASYWYEVLALSPENTVVELAGLQVDSPQGDANGRFLFEKLGIQTIFTDNGVLLKKDLQVIKPEFIEYDFINEPDLAQTFVVTCCLLKISFHFTGLQSLRIKETDRISALQTEMQKLGYVLQAGISSIEWTGERCALETRPVIATYEDHRMAMAFAPACLQTNEIRIACPTVVTKSYPTYWDDLQKAGFRISEEN
ncbi:3-phosphoshikimate 1-carboxyvinyltransferase [Bacteroidia bacterium]|nr:3-phosphoshikimate 1-carboxyvinyltransferase [Bacteroidia bacterium]